MNIKKRLEALEIKCHTDKKSSQIRLIVLVGFCAGGCEQDITHIHHGGIDYNRGPDEDKQTFYDRVEAAISPSGKQIVLVSGSDGKDHSQCINKHLQAIHDNQEAISAHMIGRT